MGTRVVRVARVDPPPVVGLPDKIEVTDSSPDPPGRGSTARAQGWGVGCDLDIARGTVASSSWWP